MKNLFCSLFLLLNYAANAQFGDLLKDKNVAWVAESSIDIRLDMLYEGDKKLITEQTKYNIDGGLTILKFQGDKSINADEGFVLFAQILLEAAKNKQIVAYSDSLCLQPIDVLPTITRVDTISQIDPPHYGPVDRLVTYILQAEDIKLFRARQITYYSPKNGTWNSRTIAVAPLKMVRDDAGNFISWKPIFWIKVEDKKAKLNTLNITWAVRTRSHGNENMVQLNTVKVHKKIDKNMSMVHFLDLVKNDNKIQLYNITNWQEKVILSFNDKQNLFASIIDTIQTIDPVTYETKVKIVQNNLDAKEITKIRLVQEWAWDNKRKILSVRLLGTAPMKEVKNEEGDFLYNQPLFYQRFDN